VDHPGNLLVWCARDASNSQSHDSRSSKNERADYLKARWQKIKKKMRNQDSSWTWTNTGKRE